MAYFVKEIFYTLQGEGRNAGRAAVFCRFAGCNLWSGREADRADATCAFYDTDFVGTNGVGGGRFTTPPALSAAIAATWRGDALERRLAVLTGGEPMLQVDGALVDALHEEGFEVAVETNGTLALAPGLDWVCVSPKVATRLKVTAGDELKLVYPQRGLDPHAFESLAFREFLLQPMDGSHRAENAAAAVAFCLAHPRWRLSMQTHKHLGIP